MPAVSPRETPDEHRRWRRLERPFLIDLVCRVFQVYASNAALRPEESFVAIDGKIGSAGNGETMGLRWTARFEPDTFPANALHNLDELYLGPISKAVERTQDFVFFEFSVLMNGDLGGEPADVRKLINLKAAGQYRLHLAVRQIRIFGSVLDELLGVICDEPKSCAVRIKNLAAASTVFGSRH